MSHPHTLSGLSPREAIADTVYRALIATDRNDVPLFNSAFVEDVTLEMVVEPGNAGGDNRVVQGLAAIRNSMLSHIGPMATTHMATNIRVDVKDGADTAHLTAYALAQHCPPGKGQEATGPKFLAGSEYVIDVVKDEADGLWKIKKWVVEVIWRQGDYSVMKMH